MARTQARLPTLAAKHDPATFMAFDVLAVDWGDLCALPWAECRQIQQDLYELSVGTSTWQVTLPSPTGMACSLPLRDGPRGRGRQTGHVALLARPAHPYWRKVKHRSYEWFDLLGWLAPKGRDPGGLLAGREGHVKRLRFPGAPLCRAGTVRRPGC
jgi:hypothetical protein